MRTLYHITINKENQEEFVQTLKSFGVKFGGLGVIKPKKLDLCAELSKYEYLYIRIAFECTVRQLSQDEYSELHCTM